LRVLRPVLAVAFALLLLRGRVWEPLVAMLQGSYGLGWRSPLLWGLGCGAAAAVARRWVKLPAVARTPWRAAAALTATACAGVGVALGVQVWVLDRVPHVQDSINYLWQARVFATGRLWLPSHPLAEFFGFRFMVNDGRWYSLFQPGWPALLAVGELLSAPWVVGPALGGLLALATWGLGRETVGRRAALLGALLLVCSPWFAFQHGSMMAHGASALLGTLALWAYLAGRRLQRPSLAALSGALLGALFCTRALDAAVLALPLGVHASWQAARRMRTARTGQVRGEVARAVLGVALLGAGALTVGSLQFAYNRALTGSWQVWPQDRYFELTEPDGSCHRLGFGRTVGCPREHGPDLDPGGFTPWRALGVSATRLRAMAVDLWGTGLGLVLLAWALAGTTRRRWALAVAVAGPIVGYFFYYYHGNCFGARYYYGALPATALLVAWTLLGLAGTERRAAPGALASLRIPLAFGLLATLLAGSLLNELPSRWFASRGAYWGVHAGLRRLVEREGLRDAVVIIPPSRYGPDLDDRDYRVGFAHARPNVDASPVVIARDHGIANPQLEAYYPTRSLYRYRPWAGVDGALVPLRRATSAVPLLLLEAEAEGKFPPVAKQDGWAAIVRFTPDLGPGPGRGHVLRLHPTGATPTIDLRQHVQVPGDYEVTLWLVRGPRQGDVQVSLDGRPLQPRFDGYANREHLARWSAASRVRLDPGVHALRLSVTGRSPASGGRDLRLDRIVFDARTGAGSAGTREAGATPR